MSKIIINEKNWKKAVVVLPGETINLETVSVFEKPDQKGEVVVKAVVAEGGFLNLKGSIKIKKGATETEAFLRQNVLLLGEKARAVAVPELEIECDEVKASHAASIGQMDEQELFYLESRGIPKDEAKKILVESFLAEVLEKTEKNEVKLIKKKLKRL